MDTKQILATVPLLSQSGSCRRASASRIDGWARTHASSRKTIFLDMSASVLIIIISTNRHSEETGGIHFFFSQFLCCSNSVLVMTPLLSQFYCCQHPIVITSPLSWHIVVMTPLLSWSHFYHDLISFTVPLLSNLFVFPNPLLSRYHCCQKKEVSWPGLTHIRVTAILMVFPGLPLQDENFNLYHFFSMRRRLCEPGWDRRQTNFDVPGHMVMKQKYIINLATIYHILGFSRSYQEQRLMWVFSLQ
jgi:hypothetical protein